MDWAALVPYPIYFFNHLLCQCYAQVSFMAIVPYFHYSSGSSRLGPWELLWVGSCVLSTCLQSFLSTSLFSDNIRLLYFPCPGISPFSKESWLLLLEKNQDLRAKSVHCCRGIIASRASQQTELENICMYTNPFTHAHTHVCVVISVYPHNY